MNYTPSKENPMVVKVIIAYLLIGLIFDEKKESENLFEVPQPPEGKRSKELHERAEKRRSGEYAGSARGSRKLW